MKTPTRRTKKRSSGAYMNRAQVRAAYVLYQNGFGLSRIAQMIYRQHGYATAKSCSDCLWKAFHREGFPLRTREQGAILANTTHGLLVGARAKPQPEATIQRNAYQRWFSAQKRRPCRATKKWPPRAGEPCCLPAQPDSDYCVSHDPAREAERKRHGRRNLRRASLAQRLAGLPTAPRTLPGESDVDEIAA